jgi:predicted nucleic acid-binding protein
MNAAVRVVLDTNVVLSALVFRGGAAGLVRQAWQVFRLIRPQSRKNSSGQFCS